LALNTLFYKSDFRFLISLFYTWFISAVVLLIASSLIISKTSLSSMFLGYTSSAISFLTAASATAIAARKSDNILLISTMSAFALIIILLSIGFTIKGNDMSASGIISVVSFTISGCLVGGVFLGNKSLKRNKKRTVNIARKNR